MLNMIYILYIVCQQLIIYNNQIDCNNENRTLFRSVRQVLGHENDQGLVQTVWTKIGYSDIEIVRHHLKIGHQHLKATSMLVTDFGDRCWRRNVLATTLRCW